jgi:hypothetical protein
MHQEAKSYQLSAIGYQQKPGIRNRKSEEQSAIG